MYEFICDRLIPGCTHTETAETEEEARKKAGEPPAGGGGGLFRIFEVIQASFSGEDVCGRRACSPRVWQPRQSPLSSRADPDVKAAWTHFVKPP